MSGLGVYADKISVSGSPEDAFVVSAVGPIRHSALRPRCAHRGGALFVAFGIEDPQGLPGDCVDGDALRERRVEVQHVVDHERRGLEARPVGRLACAIEIWCFRDELIDDDVEGTPPFAALGRTTADEVVDGSPLPRDLEVAEITGVDLGQRRVFGATDVARVAAPLAV